MTQLYYQQNFGKKTTKKQKQQTQKDMWLEQAAREEGMETTQTYLLSEMPALNAPAKQLLYRKESKRVYLHTLGIIIQYVVVGHSDE